MVTRENTMVMAMKMQPGTRPARHRAARTCPHGHISNRKTASLQYIQWQMLKHTIPTIYARCSPAGVLSMI
jgi:hypothetical protein